MKKNESVIWLPPRAVGERAFATEPCLLAWVHDGEGGYARLSLDALPAFKQVRLIFDARDVTLLRVTLPPLSGAKLRQAIPHAIEDQLLQDVNSCSIALGSKGDDGKQLISVVDRSWLEFVLGAFERRNMKVQAAWPAQFAMPFAHGRLPLACVGDGIAVRTGEQGGLGWAAGDEMATRQEAFASLLAAVLAPPDPNADPIDPLSVDTMMPGDSEPGPDSQPVADSPDTITAAASAAISASGDTLGQLQAKKVIAYCENNHWREPLKQACIRLRLRAGISRLPVPERSPINLLQATRQHAMKRRLADVNWRAWRTPALLAAASVAVFLIGLNLHWGKLAGEHSDLRAELENRFRKSFPAQKVVLDPMLQMERAVARLRASNGQSGPDDFLPLLARFAQALGPQANDALTGLEYRDGRLRVTFAPNIVAASAVRGRISDACKRLGLDLRFEPQKQNAAVITSL